MALTAAQVLALVAPEVNALASADDWLALAEESVPAGPWGTVRSKGIAYLAAHLAWQTDPTLRGAANLASDVFSTGGVTARSAGDLSESYGGGGVSLPSSSSLGDAALATTKYGLEFVRLRNSLAARLPFTARVYP